MERQTDGKKQTLLFTIHWKSGAHTQFDMERPRSATAMATPMEAVEIIFAQTTPAELSVRLAKRV